MRRKIDKKNSNSKYEKSYERRVLVAFGDITASGEFYDEVTNDAIELYPFFNEFDKFIRQSEMKTGYLFHDCGDGYMCIADFSPGDNRDIVSKFLTDMMELQNKIKWLIKTKEPPRPAGFRVSSACGYVSRKIARRQRIIWRGKKINLTHGLLEIAKKYGFVVHDSIKQLLSDEQIKKYGFRFLPIPDSDATHAWAFDIRGKS